MVRTVSDRRPTPDPGQQPRVDVGEDPASGRPPGAETAKAIVTLKLRSEFQRVRGGGRASMPAFLLEGKPRPPPADGVPASVGPRFGLTITKKLGNAVVRNRIRRRFKAALAGLAATHAAPDMDYVVVARSPAFDQDFAALAADLKNALRRVEAARTGAPRSGGQSCGGTPRGPKR